MNSLFTDCGVALEIEESEIEQEVLQQQLRWREALSEAAGIAGVVVLNSRNECEAIKNIVENIFEYYLEVPYLSGHKIVNVGQKG
ncbi:disease resistance protein (TIR-NBS-LRR class) [Spatholobus suberectus]|nr:disease resistance protein (TIR-NBS-LRR class) [Spatholobus suberectus]